MNDNSNPYRPHENPPKFDRQRALEHYVALAEEASEWRRQGGIDVDNVEKKVSLRLGER